MSSNNVNSTEANKANNYNINNVDNKKMNNKNSYNVVSIILHTIIKRKWLSLGIIISVCGAVITALYPPLVLGKIVDTLTTGSQVPVYLVFVYMAFTVIAGLMEATREGLLTVFGQKITHALRSGLMEHFVRLSTDSLNKQEPGAVVSRFVGDVDTVENLFTSGIVSMFADACKIISILVVIWFRNKGLATVLIVLLPFLFWFTRHIQKNKVVELAVKYDKLIDVHCDESDDPMSRFVELLTALSIVEGIGPKTTASHTCSLGSVDNSYAFRMMKNFKKAGLNFISCPTENIYLQGRQDTYPKRRGLTRVKELYENGINVCFAQDSIQDPWYPAGNGNLMNVLDNGIHIAQMMSFEEMDNCLDLITVNGAKTMNISDIYGIEAGKPANFIVVDARSEFEAVCERADVVASVRNGEYLFKKAPVAFEALSEFMA